MRESRVVKALLDALATWAARRSHYVSTYCLHGACSDCRLTCKSCSARCRHGCHR
jgi:hypothetical protein